MIYPQKVPPSSDKKRITAIQIRAWKISLKSEFRRSSRKRRVTIQLQLWIGIIEK
jgi:hypothetical protein